MTQVSEKVVSPSFPNGLPELRTEEQVRATRSARLSMWDTIQNGAHHGMADDQREAEWLAQRYLKRAIDMMREAISIVNDASEVARISPDAFEAFLHDDVLTEAQWDEKISEARRG